MIEIRQGTEFPNGTTFEVVLTGKWRFCPNCGAKMDGDADG